MNIVATFIDSKAFGEALTEEHTIALQQQVRAFDVSKLPKSGLVELVVDGITIIGRLVVMATSRRFTVVDIIATGKDIAALVHKAKRTGGTKAERQAARAARTAERKAQRQAKRKP